jgi:hypothetical protein
MTATTTRGRSSHAAQVPTVAAEYFGISRTPALSEHPIVTHVFYPGRGWVRHPVVKRISGSEVRRLQSAGATAVVLSVAGRPSADFRLSELDGPMFDRAAAAAEAREDARRARALRTTEERMIDSENRARRYRRTGR